MKKIVPYIYLLFNVCFSQEKDILIVASSVSEGEVVVKIINNTSYKKLLFLDLNNLGVVYNDKVSFTNNNSSKIYLNFFDLKEKNIIVPISNLNIYNSGTREEEDFINEINNSTIYLLPHAEKKIRINLYDQNESTYLKTHKILPAKNYKVCLKIYGEKIKEKLKKSNLSKKFLKNILSRYDFNDYISNEFDLKIKMVKSPVPPPLPPGKNVKLGSEYLTGTRI